TFVRAIRCAHRLRTGRRTAQSHSDVLVHVRARSTREAHGTYGTLRPESARQLPGARRKRLERRVGQQLRQDGRSQGAVVSRGERRYRRGGALWTRAGCDERLATDAADG